MKQDTPFIINEAALTFNCNIIEKTYTIKKTDKTGKQKRFMSE